MKPPRFPRRERGSSFIEILIALAILAVLMVGVLQMFSVALIMNNGSSARTDLLYKAQQVVENLRLIQFLERSGSPAARIASGIQPLAATTTPIYLPFHATDTSTTLTWAYWGPDGFAVVDQERLPYRLSYTIENRDANFWLVTVTATPVDNPNLSATLPAPGANDRRYLGPASKLKIVTYAAQIEK
jgi:prepilin-type N-terminal cleavage/methylation domain-containing protein